MLAPYSVAYGVTFESDDEIVATSTGQVRYRPHRRLVLESEAPAYVFVAGSRDDRIVGSTLGSSHYEHVRQATDSIE